MRHNDYSEDKKNYSENMSDYDPNVGENQVNWSGNTEGGRTAMTYDKQGVEDGLSSLEMVEVKNAERVYSNQRPKGKMEMISNEHGSFEIGT